MLALLLNPFFIGCLAQIAHEKKICNRFIDCFPATLSALLHTWPYPLNTAPIAPAITMTMAKGAKVTFPAFHSPHSPIASA
jgi:hypothetical protein